MRGSIIQFITSAVAATSFLIASNAAHADTGGEWVRHASMQLPRQECGAARIGDTVYVVGGLIVGFSATDTAEAYDIASDTWSSIAPMPASRDHLAVAAVEGMLYVIGGFAADFLAKRDVFVYDPAANKWSQKADLPEARGASWAVAHDGRIYVFGGVDPARIARRTTFIYDPAADEWTRGADMPTAREHLTAARVGDFIYVIGGRRGGSFNLNERYDTANNQWRTMAPMPTARSAMVVASFGRRIVVAGGEVPRLFEVNEVYDVVSDTWDCDLDMAIPRHGLAAVTLEDRILAPAGGLVQGLAPTALVDSFIPPPATNGDINEINVIDGTHLAGGLASIFESDDHALHTEARVTAEVHQPHLLQIIFSTMSDVRSPGEISITFEARITDVEASVTLSLRDWDANQFVVVGQFTNGLQESVNVVNVADAGRFVRPSDGRIELLVKKIVFFPFTLNGFNSFIDQVEITVR